MTICIGLDLSMISPGVSVYDTSSGQYTLYGFVQRVRERGFTRTHGQASIVLLPSIPNTPSTTNEARYEHIRYHIVETILSPFKGISDVVVGIEGYAFGTKGSGSSYKLQELGGVLKHSIRTQYPLWRQDIIPPTRWKKTTLGNGRASKADIVEYVRTQGPEVPLMELLGLVASKNGDIPCPAQDLADAACISLSVSLPCTSPEHGKHKKRKRDVPVP
jgi:Holliday junction resolvasome RuvABC endonuclease subunit